MVCQIARRLRVCGVAALLVCLLHPPTTSAEADAPNSQGAAPLTLDRSIQLALQNHPDIIAAAAALEQAHAAVTEAQARRSYPVSIGADAEASRGAGGGNPDAGFRSLSMQAGYDLDIAGKRKLAVNVATKNLQASQADLETARRAVAQGVVETYFNVLSAQRAVVVAQQGLTQAKDQLQRSQALFKEQLIPRLDIVRAEAQVSRSEQEIIAAQGQLTAAQATLRSLIGLSPEAPVAIVEVSEATSLGGAVEYLQTQALTSSPLLQSLHAQIARVEVEIKQAQSLRKPNLSLQASHRITSDPADYHNRTGVDLVASIALDDWHAEPAALVQARAHLKTLQAQWQEAERQLKLQVLRAWVNLKSQQGLVEAAKQGLTVTDENVRLTQIGYEAQVNTMKEVLDAQTELTRARAAYWNAVYEAATSAASIQILTGAALDRVAASHNEGGQR